VSENDGQQVETATDHADGLDGVDGVDELVEVDFEVIERAILNDSEEGRAIQAAFIEHFGQFMVDKVRPVLRDVAADGGQPQLLVNGLAELMRSVAESIEFPLGHPRSGFPPKLPHGSA
jgi:hypothetical protein